MAVRKLEGVQSVDVSLNEGVATMELTAVNSITIEQLRSAIRDQGFSPRETTLTLSAEIQSRGDGFVAVLPGSQVTYSLRGDDRTLAGLARAVGSVATLRGVVDRDDENGDTPTTLVVSGLNRQ